MREVIQIQKPVNSKWTNLNGLSTFLILSLVFHMCVFSAMSITGLEKKIENFQGNILQSLTITIAGTHKEHSSINSFSKYESSNDSPISKQEFKKEQTSNAPVEVLQQDQPKFLGPQIHPWFRNTVAEPMLMQQIYLQQQRNFIYQHTNMQIQALLNELAPEISEDLFCEDQEGELICNQSLPRSKINLIKSIQQIARLQLQWQLIGNTIELPTHGAKLALKL